MKQEVCFCLFCSGDSCIFIKNHCVYISSFKNACVVKFYYIFIILYFKKNRTIVLKTFLLFYEKGTFRNLIIFFILAETSLLLYNVLVLEIFCVDSLSGHTPTCECRVMSPVCSHRAGAGFPDGLSARMQVTSLSKIRASMAGYLP